MRHLFILLPVIVAAACAEPPPRYREVITFKAGDAPSNATPSPGTVWRLDETELKALSPAPLVPAPPPPRFPPPRPNAAYPPPPPGYGPPSPMY